MYCPHRLKRQRTHPLYIYSIREPRFNSETLSEQTKKLDNFCKTHCGTLLNEKVRARIP